jgi:hypothetical protein
MALKLLSIQRLPDHGVHLQKSRVKFFLLESFPRLLVIFRECFSNTWSNTDPLHDILHLQTPASAHAFQTTGEFHDQGDAKWIVIRRQLSGHNDFSFGRPTSGWPIGRLQDIFGVF